MAIWQYFLLFGTVLIGGGLAQYSAERGEDERWKRFLPLLLSFSGAYLLGITSLEMIPSVFSRPYTWLGVWLLGGFFTQLVLEGFSQGVEHGHIHAQRDANYGYALQIMVGLGLHAFLEGLPLGAGLESGGLHAGHDHAGHLLYGIVLHKLPAAFALGLLLRISGYSRRVVWLCLFVFACLSPLGTVVGELIAIDPEWRARILALVIGSFLHISTTILFEADGSHRHGISPRKFLIIIAGMVLAFLTAH